MQDVIKKLIHALEDKVTTEMFAGQAANELDTNFIIQQDKGQTLGQRKGSLPPPVNYTHRIMNESGLKQAINKLPSILPQMTPTGERMIQFELPGKIKNVNETQGNQAQEKLFLKRLHGIKDKMDTDMQQYLQSQGGDRDMAPKGGKQLLKAERKKRSQDLSANSTFDPS